MGLVVRENVEVYGLGRKFEVFMLYSKEFVFWFKYYSGIERLFVVFVFFERKFKIKGIYYFIFKICRNIVDLWELRLLISILI